uniref:Isocitrate dehydrogenase [NAD] subunit, mitochondrial n=1 Tax=Macrostomum lignano TaxID=282301 RepID=A0A1I8J3J7_9PLAT
MLLPQLRRLAPLAYRGLSSQSAAAVPNSTPLQQTVTVVPGDGVFPELLDATKQVLKAAGAPLAYEQVYVSDVNRSLSQPLDTLMESIQRNKVALMGIMSHPTYGSDLASSSMRLRRKLDMFASCVNVRSMPGITSRHKSINLVIIREQTEGEYSALEHETVPGVVESLKIVTRKNSERIAKFAFDYAVKNGRKRVTAVHKANIMKLGDGLFLESCKEVSQLYPGIELENMIIDNCCMQLVSRPEQFDVMVMPNLYGNIIDNLASGLVGGAGIVPGASYSHDCVIFESGARHPFAQAVGKDIANPTAMFLASANMLNHLNLPMHGRRIRQAVFRVLEAGKCQTRDLGGHARTSEFTYAVINNME